MSAALCIFLLSQEVTNGILMRSETEVGDVGVVTREISSLGIPVG